MTEKQIIDELLDHYEGFFLMTRSAAMLGTKHSDAFDRDASAVIGFIGKAYGWPQERIGAARSLILGDMMRVGLVADYLALSAEDYLDEHTKEHMLLYEIKGVVIEEVNRSRMTGALTGKWAELEVKNSMAYLAFHHDYEPRLCFAQVRRSSDRGDTVGVMQEAVMRLLGIGCQKDILIAQRLLQNLLLWGEKSAAVILSFLWSREGNTEMQTYYRAIYDILERSCFFCEEDTPACPDRAEEFCILINAVQTEIVRGCNRPQVDMFFADLMYRDEIPFEEKLEFVRRYREGYWLTCLTEYKKPRRIGFRMIESGGDIL